MGCMRRNLIAVALAVFLASLAIPSLSPLLTRTSVTGVVYAEGGIPIPGATVSVVGSGTGFAIADSEGRYTLNKGLGTGTCAIIVAAPMYIDRKIENVQVVAGQVTSGISIFLKRSGVISGMVYSEGGGPPPPPPGGSPCRTSTASRT